MKKVLLFGLIFLALLSISIRFAIKPISEVLGYQTKAGIKITSTPESTVFINGVEVGKTPYQDENLKVGEVEVSLVKEGSSWQGRVGLYAGTLSVVNRELAPDTASLSGEILTLDTGKGIIITSSPSEASVEIDGKAYGKTPISILELLPGEHTFILSREGYLNRSIRAALPPNLVLYLNIDLALSEANISTSVNLPAIQDATAIRLIVKKTPNGFLRIRSKPSISGAEVGRVNTGDTLTLVSEQSGWYRIKTDEGIEGYVVSTYVQKQP